MRFWRAFADRLSLRRPIGAGEAERLLAGRQVPAHAELSRLLGAATAPPRADELAGLDAALAAFEEAGQLQRPAAAKPHRRVLRPLAAAVATAVVLLGGVAVAAQAGYLSRDGQPPAQQTFEPGETPAAAPTTPGGASGPARTPEPTARGDGVLPADKATKLCRAWDSRQRQGTAMKLEDLRELAGAAGGEQRIPTFCAPRLRQHGNRPATPPTPNTQPTPGRSAPDGDDEDNETNQRDNDEDDEDEDD